MRGIDGRSGALGAAGALGLVVRARREEAALAARFGPEWDDYRRRVPAWLPGLPRHG